MKRSYFGFILMLLLLTSTIVTVNAEEIVTEKFLNQQQESLEIYQILTDTFLEIEKSPFPEYYSGCYIDDDGKLVILVTSKNAMDRINSILERDDLNYRVVKYSYGYLNQLKESIYKDTFNENSLVSKIEINTITLDVKNNVVKIGITNPSNAMESKINEEYGCDGQIELYFQEKIVAEQTANPGGETYIEKDTQYYWEAASVAFPAKKLSSGSWIYGVVSTGHVDGSIQNDVRISMLEPDCGYLFSKKITSKADASFLVTDSNVTRTKTTASGLTLSTSPYTGTNIPQGTYICKEGQSTGKTCGTVTDGNANVNIDGYLHQNFVLSTYSSSAGDSGGVVYIPQGTYIGQLLGVHSGSNGCFCYYKNVADALGVVFGT